MRKDNFSNEFFIAAKSLTRCALNTEAIIRTFIPLWRVRTSFKVRTAGDYIILFFFENEADIYRILASQSWSYDKHLVVLQCYDNHSLIQEVPLKF